MAELIPLDKIRIDGGTQPRVAIDSQLVEEYAQDIARGAEMPAGDAIFDGLHYWLWDGFHRLHGHRRAGKTAMLLNVRPGTVDEARWLCCGANATNGLRRTNEDKRRAVEMALQIDLERARKTGMPTLSDRAIADHCGVAPTTVGAVRESLSVQLGQMPPARTVERGGQTYTMQTANIGKRPAPPPAPLPPTDAVVEADDDEDDEDEPVQDETLLHLEVEAANRGDYEEAAEYRDERLARLDAEEPQVDDGTPHGTDRLAEALRLAAAFRREVIAYALTPAGAAFKARINPRGGKTPRPLQLDEFIDLLAGSEPAAVGCFRCDGTDRHCVACYGNGWVRIDVWKDLRDVDRAKLTPFAGADE